MHEEKPMQKMNKGQVSDKEGHYDMDGVSISAQYGVVVSGEKIPKTKVYKNDFYEKVVGGIRSIFS